MDPVDYFSFVYKLIRLTKSNFYRGCIIVCAAAGIGAAASECFSLSEYRDACIVAAVVAVLTAYGRHVYLDDCLELAARKGDLLGLDYNPSAVLSGLREINQDDLLGSQVERFERYKVFSLIFLGSNRVARELLTGEGAKSRYTPAFRHFALHIIADRAGDYEGSQLQLNKAMAHKDDRGTDPLTMLQLEHNQAVLNIQAGRFEIAEDELNKVLLRAEKLGVTNKGFINNLYENLVLNKTRLGLSDGGRSAGEEAIDGYAQRLNLRRSEDVLALFNLKLLFLRQLGASSAEKGALCNAHLKWLMSDSRLSSSQKVCGAASMLKAAYSDGIDPMPAIRILMDNRDALRQFSPANRYSSFSNVRDALPHLYPQAAEVNELAQLMEQYFKEDAEGDLKSLENSLPAEACSQRAAVLKERAGLAQEKGDCDSAERLMGEAIALLESNLLFMDAVEYRLSTASMLVCLPNGGASKREEILEHVAAVKGILSGLQRDPSLGYPYSQLAFVYALMNMRDECIDTYRLAESFGTSMDHYAPMVKARRAIAATCARFFLFLREIEILKHQGFPDYASTAARRWVEQFPRVHGIGCCLLLGRFLGYEGDIPLVGRRQMSLGGTRCQEFCWLSIPEMNLAVDPLISRTRDEAVGYAFFEKSHPMLNITEEGVRKIENSGFRLAPPVFVAGSEEMLDEAERMTLAEVLELLDRATEGEQPTKEELRQIVLGSVVDIPMPSGC